MESVEGFDLEAELGRGAMGVVHRARQRSTGRAVALKVMRVRLTDTGTHRERFRREGEVLASLRHPGILGVHAAGVDGDVAWLACELIEDARTLDEAARGEPLRRKVELVRDVARALGHAHAAGIVHRDVKPGNVLVDRLGQVHVADFGVALADVHERLTRTGQLVGTPVYMPPEQLFGKREEIGPATDVWAAGAVLYELVAGRLPFEGASLSEISARVATGSPDPPSSHAGEVPLALDAVILSALASEPGARPRDGEALAVELDAWLAGREPAVVRSARSRLRRRALRGGAAALVLVLLAATVREAIHAARRREALASLDEALEWDGAPCASGERACAGGPHVLSAWSFGAGDGPAPAAADLRARATRLGALAAGLRDEGPREVARAAWTRLLAHERLVKRRREPGREPGDAEADRVVTALLLVEDRAASPASVDEALRRALAARGPGAPAAVADAWRRALERDLAVTPDGVGAALAAAPTGARPPLLQAAGAWVARRATAAQTALLAGGSLEAATHLPALCELAEATGVGPAIAAERVRLLAPWGRLLEDSSRGQLVGQDDLPAGAPALWRAVARAPRAELATAAATLAAAFGPARASTDGRALLRGVRLAALASLHAGLDLDALGTSARPATRSIPPSSEALLAALTFEAVACRLDGQGTLRLPYGGAQAVGALARASASAELLAETLVASLRLEDTTGAAAHGTAGDPWSLRIATRPPGERRDVVAALDALVAARPWSSAALLARTALEPDDRQDQALALWADRLRALQGPAMDLSRAAASGLVGGLSRTVLLLPEDQAPAAIDLLWAEARRWKTTPGLSDLLDATAEVELRRRPGVAPIGELECRLGRWLEVVQLGREKLGVVLWNLGRRRAEREPALAERLLVEAAARDEEVARSFWPPSPLDLAQLRLRLKDPAGARQALAQADLDPRRDEPAFVALAARVERELDGAAAAVARIDRAIAANPAGRAELLQLREAQVGP